MDMYLPHIIAIKRGGEACGCVMIQQASKSTIENRFFFCRYDHKTPSKCVRRYNSQFSVNKKCQKGGKDSTYKEYIYGL